MNNFWNKTSKTLGKIGLGLIAFATLLFLLVVIIGLACYDKVFWGLEKAALPITLVAFIAQCICFSVGATFCALYLVGCKKCEQDNENPKLKTMSFIAAILGVILLVTLLICSLTSASSSNESDENDAYFDFVLAYGDVRDQLNLDDWYNYWDIEVGCYTLDSNPRDSSNEITQANGYVALSQIVPALHKEIGVPSYVWERMKSTTALQGVQTETYKNLKITWTYHPDRGLEIMYTEID